MVHPFLQVALGGAVGASLRYALGLGMARAMGGPHLGGFPLAILTANIVGCFLMGVFIAAASRHELAHVSPLVATGLLGGFTTFSSFSMETILLWERGAVGQAALYVVLSVGLSLLALVLGLAAARALT